MSSESAKLVYPFKKGFFDTGCVDMLERPIAVSVSRLEIRITTKLKKQLLIIGMMRQEPVQATAPEHILLGIVIGITNTFGHLSAVNAALDQCFRNIMDTIACRIYAEPKIQVVQQSQAFAKRTNFLKYTLMYETGATVEIINGRLGDQISVVRKPAHLLRKYPCPLQITIPDQLPFTVNQL